MEEGLLVDTLSLALSVDDTVDEETTVTVPYPEIDERLDVEIVLILPLSDADPV